jgi:4-hydroxybenzoate polyprenyltransferase
MASAEDRRTGRRDESGSRRGPGRSPRGGLFGRLGAVGDAVMIRHTLFSLPFALSAILLESAGRPPAAKLLWIVVAAVGARNAANALNRLIDHEIDGKNPRTAGRALPAGSLSRRELWLFTGAMGAMLILGAAMLNTLCLALLPAAAILVFGYSYTKRFTWLCHFWLGVTCSAATMGAFLGISGTFQLRYFPLVGGVALWVAGFDIIYAIQDIGFDRAQGLRSVPARFGARGARLIAAACHLAALAGMASVFLFWPETGIGTALALAACAVLLAAEHVIALGGTERHVKIAAYGINEIIPFLFLVGVALDQYLI